ncbi:HPr family phosphocarrier protein [Blautia producta]|uniref:HPr family phosphocarrier protein n=1 Tax=Blautia producta TaxID=33035 RepID=UPI0031B5A01C
MKTITMFIKLQSIDKVKHFVNDVSKMQGDFDLTAGRHVINAKSVMGIFSLDLSKPLQLKISGAEEEDIEKLKKYC